VRGVIYISDAAKLVSTSCSETPRMNIVNGIRLLKLTFLFDVLVLMLMLTYMRKRVGFGFEGALQPISPNGPATVQIVRYRCTKGFAN